MLCGRRLRWNAWSEFMARSMPGMAGIIGCPPTAIRMWPAVQRRPSTSTVCASRTRRQNFDLCGAQDAFVGLFEARNLGIFVGDQRAPAEFGLVGHPAEACR